MILGIIASSIISSTDLYPGGNAASIGDEADAVGTEWILSSDTFGTWTSDSVAPHVGSYNLKLVAITTWANINLSFTAVSGNTYRVSWAHKATQYNEQATHSWTGVVTSPNIDITETSWTEKSVDVEANAITITMWFAASAGSGVAGDTLELDKFSIIDLGVV